MNGSCCAITGTPEERGLKAWANEMSLNMEPSEDDEKIDKEYVYNTFDFPIGMTVLRK